MTEADPTGALIRALTAARQAATLYPLGHPERRTHGTGIADIARRLAAESDDAHVVVFVDRGSFYLGTTLLPRESLGLGRFAADLEQLGIESMLFGPQVAADDVDMLVEILAGQAPLRTELGAIRLNAVRPRRDDLQPWQRRLADLRRSYAAGIGTLRSTAQQVAAGQPLDLDSATSVVDQLYDEVELEPGYSLLLTAVKSYDEYTYFHMVNVCMLSVALGQAIGLRRDQVMVLGLGGLLHDIGKVYLPPDVLNGTGRLDEEQWRLVQRHPVDGAGMLLATGPGLYHPAASVLLEHHAAYDRSGYPPLHDHGPSVPSRLVAVADCFDAVTSKRSYREALDRHRALDLLGFAAGSGLDPHAVTAFQALLGRFPVGSLVRLSSGEVAVIVRQHEQLIERPTVLVLFDASDSPVQVEERDLSVAAPHGPKVVARLDPQAYGVDLSRFVVSGEVQATGEGGDTAGGLVHEPSPGEATPEGYVDSHAEQEHTHRIDGRPDPDVAPPIE